MLRAGCLEGVDEVYGMHNWPTVPVGHMRVKEGALMAHVAEFTILVLGKGTHGSQPQEGVDPVLAGAALVGALHSIVSRSLHYQHSAVLSVTQFHAGEVNNVIPDTATLSGTIRDFDQSVFKAICKRIEEVAHGTCAAYGATATVTIEDDYPVVSNHQAQTAVVEAVGSAVLGGLDSEARTRRESLLPTPSSSSSSPLPPPPPSSSSSSSSSSTTLPSCLPVFERRGGSAFVAEVGAVAWNSSSPPSSNLLLVVLPRLLLLLLLLPFSSWLFGCADSAAVANPFEFRKAKGGGDEEDLVAATPAPPTSAVVLVGLDVTTAIVAVVVAAVVDVGRGGACCCCVGVFAAGDGCTSSVRACSSFRF
mmetsp:Transcript_10516/g.20891  ORF Transcript_10516/g.20891 Transcript_10516/m.20891 type:complete len:363 (+) Transcript_10516:934-2022(+)